MTPRTPKPRKARRAAPADEAPAEQAAPAEQPAAASAPAPIEPQAVVLEPPRHGQGPRGWRVLAAVSTGAAHLRYDQPCQDALAWRMVGDGALLVAIADGAGSAAHSAQGARLAVDTAVERLAQALGEPAAARPEVGEADAGEGNVAGEGDDPPQAALETPHVGLILEAFSAARQALEQLADEQAQPLREYSATLSIVLAGRDFLAAGAVGDCAVVVGSSDERLETVMPLERGEYANETHFITAADALERVRLYEQSVPATRLALFSDGLARLALRWPEQKPHRPFFAPLFAFAAGLPPAAVQAQSSAASATAEGHAPGPGGDALENAGLLAGASAQLAAFLASERVNSRTDDDKTLVLAVFES